MIPNQSSIVRLEGDNQGLATLYAKGLASGDIHVWLNPCGDRLGAARPQPAEAVAQNDASQTVLRSVLALYVGTPIGQRDFRRAPLGKPYLEGGPCFNLSHSAGATAIAVSLEDVGIDIEHPQRQTSSHELARKYFTSAENAFLAACPKTQVGRAFLHHWVAKEAITKLVGVGIYRGLRHAETNQAISPPSASYKGRVVSLAACGKEIGMIGALATWKPAKVNVFVIGENSAIID